MTRNGEVSFWWQQQTVPAPRAPLGADIDVDVCIVGGGYTGLWTAYALAEADPALRIAIIEQRFAGFGASGRNGGWVSGAVTGGREQFAKTHGRDAAIAQQRAHNDAVLSVLDVIQREGLDADAHLGGELRVARNAAQLARLQAEFRSESTWPATDLQLLSGAEATDRIAVNGVLGAIWDPHCARIHPVKLVRALATLVERRGVTIYEDTTAVRLLPGRVDTDRGTVRAPNIVRATEGFTANIPGQHRTWLPMNSSMIVTEPIPAERWGALGWNGCETLGDQAHVYMYAQRTADDRIAFGGRGVPYRFGSKVDTDGATQQRTIASLTAHLRDFFPAITDVEIEHGWAGVLAVPRDWTAAVHFDATSGMGHAGGYVGTGVASANLAGRTLADLILRRDTELTRLPWVGHAAKKWEIEPLRWSAVQGIYAAYRTADRLERGGSARTAWPAKIADVIAGR